MFISYQWDNQNEVKSLRDKLERVGYSCWMDIGQMGGGDQLNMRIEEGIRNSKVRGILWQLDKGMCNSNTRQGLE